MGKRPARHGEGRREDGAPPASTPERVKNLRSANRRLSQVVAELEASRDELRASRDELQASRDALAASHEKYRTLFANMSEAFILGEPILDENGQPVDFRWLEVNDAFEKETGLTRAVLGKPARTFLPNLEQSWVERYGRVALTGQPEHFQDFNADTGRYYEAYCFSPAPGQFAVIGRDVSDRLRMETALRESERRYMALFHARSHAIAHMRILTDGDGRPVDFIIERVNAAYEQILGRRRDQVEGRRFSDAFPREDIFGVDLVAVFGHVAQQRAESRFDMHVQPSDQWLSVYAYSPRAGECTALFTDETSRKRMEEALRRERAQLRAILDNAAPLIAMKDVHGYMILSNRAMQELLDLPPPEEQRGRHVNELFPPDIARVWWANDLAALREGRTLHIEETIRLRDGLHTYLSVKFPVREADGEPPYAVGAISTDITERKRLEREVQEANRALEDRVRQRTAELEASNRALSEEVAHRGEAEAALREAHERLKASLVAEQDAKLAAVQARRAADRARAAAEHANRAKSEFLATMSHEIRTPLNGVIGFTGLLLDGPLGEDKRRYAELARESGETLLQLLNDFLDFSKIEAGRLELELTDFDPHQEAANAIALVEAGARQKGLALRCDIAGPHRVRGDPARLRQILLNLLGNAVKFTAAGHVALRCRELRREGDTVWLAFEVSDTGIGISPAVQARLFEPFVQADASTTRRYGGSGLGLVISKRLAEAMGGRIVLQSVRGQGSTFTVELPFALRPDGGAGDAGGAGPARLRRFQGRVLVAEDDRVSQLLATELLKRLGCHVDVVGNGQEALEAVRKLPYDLVFMDCHMPVLDGLSATRAIRARETGAAAEGGATAGSGAGSGAESGTGTAAGQPRHVPVIAMTAAALQGDTEKCMAAGMDGFMSKPIRMEDLARVLATWLPAREPPH